MDLTDATVRRLGFSASRVEVVDVGVAAAEHLDLRGSQVATLNGIRTPAGVVLDEDQARWFAPLLAAKLGALVVRARHRAPAVLGCDQVHGGEVRAVARGVARQQAVAPHGGVGADVEVRQG